MRALAVALVFLIVAAVAVLLFFVSGLRPLPETDGAGVDRERIDSIERSVRDLQQRIALLCEAQESVQDEMAQLGERLQKAAQRPEPPETGRETGLTPVKVEPEGEKSKKPVLPPAGESEQLRAVIREEIKRVEEERKKELEEQRKAMQPEEWEREEFGHYAWQVHNTGNKLELSDSQKRQYYSVIKDHDERIRSLWNDLKEQHPESDMRKLSKLYQERLKEMLITTRDMVTSILNSKQQKKYQQMCKDNQWIK